MKNTIEFMKKNENIFIILLIFISLIGVTFSVKLAVGDELWNFQNVYKIYNGYQIYKDANVICTPLFFYIGNIMFNILGANFFVFRIYNILILIFYYFMTYKILRELGINIKISLISVLILIMFGTYELPRVMANYNTLAMAFSLLGLYLLIKNKCKINTKNIIIQSVICFLVIMTKQNIGVYYFIALTVIILLKKEKNKIIGILQEAGILLTLSVLFLISLKVNGLLDWFIDYAILGINQFVNENTLISIPCIITYISILLTNLCISIFLVKQSKKIVTNNEKNNLFVLNCFSIVISLLIYPIINLTHLLVAINMSIILLIYIVSIILKKGQIRLMKTNFVITLVLVILILLNVIINMYCFIYWSKEVLNKEYNYKYEQAFFGAIVDDDIYRNIEKVTNYIKEKEKEGKNVIIFSSRAALYMIPMRRSNGFYDLPLNGNFGNLNEQDVLNDLRKKENTLILVRKDEKYLNWQENRFIIQEIKENFNYVDDIEEFSVYTP